MHNQDDMETKKSWSTEDDVSVLIKLAFALTLAICIGLKRYFCDFYMLILNNLKVWNILQDLIAEIWWNVKQCGWVMRADKQGQKRKVNKVKPKRTFAKKDSTKALLKKIVKLVNK